MLPDHQTPFAPNMVVKPPGGPGMLTSQFWSAVVKYGGLTLLI